VQDEECTLRKRVTFVITLIKDLKNLPENLDIMNKISYLIIIIM